MYFFCDLLRSLHAFSISRSFPQPGTDTEFLLILLRGTQVNRSSVKASKEKPRFIITRCLSDSTFSTKFENWNMSNNHLIRHLDFIQKLAD